MSLESLTKQEAGGWLVWPWSHRGPLDGDLVDVMEADQRDTEEERDKEKKKAQPRWGG